MREINWLKTFKNICKRDKGALEWGLPEQWIHAELFSELKKQSDVNNWVPFPDEVPYITFCPVKLPKKTNRDWIKIGAVKYVDICLKNKDLTEFLWFEFKVRNIIYNKNFLKANFESRDAFKKDVASLIGFDKELTAKTWESPDPFTKSYKFDLLLKDNFKKILKAKHKFVSCYLHLNCNMEDKIWDEKELKKNIFNWYSLRTKYCHKKVRFPEIKIKSYKDFYNGKHSLIICIFN